MLHYKPDYLKFNTYKKVEVKVEYTASMTMKISKMLFHREFIEIIMQSGNFPHRRYFDCTEVSSLAFALLYLDMIKAKNPYCSKAFNSCAFCLAALPDPIVSKSSTVQYPKYASSRGRRRFPDLSLFFGVITGTENEFCFILY